MIEIDKPKHINTLAVDADIVCFRVSAVHEMSNLEALHEGINEFMYNISRETLITRFIMCLSDKTNFRYRVAKTVRYKHNRYDIEGKAKVPKPRLLTAAKQYVKDKYKGFIYEDMEADDSIVSLISQNENVGHAGIDKDIKAYEGYHYDFVTRKWLYTSKEESELAIWRQVCTGDYGDGIPGLDGVGIGTASKHVTDAEYAEDQAYALYCTWLGKKGLIGMDVLDYFDEQMSLILMRKDLVISNSHVVDIVPPKIFDSHEGGFTGFDKPKLNMV